MRPARPFLGLLVMAAAALPHAALAVEPVVDGPSACLQVAIDKLPEQAKAAAMQIDDLPRRLLATSMYMQARGLEARWSWSEEKIRDYQTSPEHDVAIAAIAKVQDRFAELNPGYALRVNTEVRSLETQLASWAVNDSVGAAAASLATAAVDKCNPKAPAKFAAWLRTWKPESRPTLSVPGLSPHGQAEAFDFQVVKGNALVAPPDSGRIQADWIEGGWSAKLAQAIKEAGPAFKGPLLSPNEPWHYAYDPKAAALAAGAEAKAAAAAAAAEAKAAEKAEKEKADAALKSEPKPEPPPAAAEAKTATVVPRPKAGASSP